MRQIDRASASVAVLLLFVFLRFLTVQAFQRRKASCKSLPWLWSFWVCLEHVFVCWHTPRNGDLHSRNSKVTMTWTKAAITARLASVKTSHKKYSGSREIKKDYKNEQSSLVSSDTAAAPFSLQTSKQQLPRHHECNIFQHFSCIERKQQYRHNGTWRCSPSKQHSLLISSSFTSSHTQKHKSTCLFSLTFDENDRTLSQGL